MEKTKIICPFCESENIEKRRTQIAVDDYYEHYHCKDCHTFFDDTDIEVEDLRHKISLLLNGTDENNPIKCNILVGEEEAQGLSTLQMPHIDKCYQIPGDGTMWFHIKYSPDEEWMNFDDFDMYDLKKIYEGLVNQK